METTKPKPFVFVLMPFESDLDDVYQIAIQEACSKAGAYCQRLDDQIFEESMLERIYNEIAKADLLIADMTGRNPNVFYEVGYAHALGKRVILITEQVKDIPFDLKHRYHVKYNRKGQIHELRDELEKRVRWYLENPEQSATYEESELEFYINEIRLEPNTIIPVSWQSRSGEYIDSHTRFVSGGFIPESYLPISVAVHNPSIKTIQAVSFASLLITPSIFYKSVQKYDDVSVTHQSIPMPDGRIAHKPESNDYVVPGGWDSIEFHLLPKRRHEIEGDFEFMLRILSDGPAVDIPFTITIPQRDKKD